MTGDQEIAAAQALMDVVWGRLEMVGDDLHGELIRQITARHGDCDAASRFILGREVGLYLCLRRWGLLAMKQVGLSDPKAAFDTLREGDALTQAHRRANDCAYHVNEVTGAQALDTSDPSTQAIEKEVVKFLVDALKKSQQADLVISYTRAQAIDDGVLVDLTDWATKEMIGGFSIPVAVTSAVWADIENIPPSRQGIEDVRGRAHDLLWMAACAARASKGENAMLFRVIMPVGRRRNQIYRAVVGPGDDGEPVMTIMRRGED